MGFKAGVAFSAVVLRGHIQHLSCLFEYLSVRSWVSRCEMYQIILCESVILGGRRLMEICMQREEY